MSYLKDLANSRELLVNLTQREVRGKYKRTALGQLWSLANPIAAIIIYTFVFSFIFQLQSPVGDPSGLENYALFLVCGLITWMILGVTFIALQNAWWQKWVGAGLMILLAWGIPVWILQIGGHKTGEQIQPRYLLPLFIVAIGVLLLQKTSDQVLLSSRPAQIGVTLAVALANSLALHANFRRYTTGTVQGGADLDHQREWWWMSMPDFLGANATWAIGSLAFLGLMWIVLSHANSPSVEPSREKVPSSTQS